MFFDYSSLLTATGVAALAAALTFFLSWSTGRNGGFLVTCSVAMLVIAFSITQFMMFTATDSNLFGAIACASLLVAYCIGLGSAVQFRTNRLHRRKIVTHSAAMVGLVTLPYLFGLNGTSFVITNGVAAALLSRMAWEYWRCRRESPVVITVVSCTYGAVALSYLACAATLASQSPLTMAGPPDNLAETINMIVSLLGVTGIGALNVALNHQRLVKRHRRESQTDQLTGMLNRRALFDNYGELGLAPGSAIAVFDLDRFKSVNDDYGHEAGDTVLKTFAEVCRKHINFGDEGMRLGGEEFLIVFPRSGPSAALAICEAIRADYARTLIPTRAGQAIKGTVSVGIYANTDNMFVSIDTALSRADKALYAAKEAGRNRIVVGQSGQPALARPIFNDTFSSTQTA